ncbi:MAG: hypothetical protein GTO40_04775 [Deltaproteobacteria bacterium]|nr:hypothetical protein [Deltaproteobacteria bacterium]
MTKFINEHLEIYTDHRGEWYRCAHCAYLLSPASEDWRKGCLVQQVAPKAEAVVSELLSPYWYRQHCCSSCGALLETNLMTQEGEVVR